MSNELVKQYHKLVTKIVLRFRPSDYDTHQDMYQEGMIALLAAKNTYVDNGRCKFIGYASGAIKHKMMNFIKNNRTVHIPVDRLNEQNEADWGKSYYYDDSKYSDNDNEVVNNVLQDEQRRIMYESISKSSKEIVKKYFEDGKTMTEISSELGITSQGVRWKIRNELTKLQKSINKQG